MKISKLCFIMIAFVAIGLIGVAAQSFAAHPDVVLKDTNGSAIGAASAVAYSPKQTCGGCHDYESAMTTVQKQQGTGAAYNVPVPQHGVSASYHVQQGRNVPWGATQRSYYHLAGFTSSPGMYGKY